MSSRRLVPAIAGTLLALAIPLAASAHAELIESEPSPDAFVTVVPPELIARFSQDLRPDRTSIEVRDPSGATIASGGKDPDKARLQRAPLPSLLPGTYEVRWVSYSAEDGELARGRYRFTVEVAPSLAPLPSCVPSPEESPAASLLAMSPEATAGPAASVIPLLTFAPSPLPSGAPCAEPGQPSPTASAGPLPSPAPSIAP